MSLLKSIMTIMVVSLLTKNDFAVRDDNSDPTEIGEYVVPDCL
jgi:hypothetical protein